MKSIAFGELIWDVYPDGNVIGGAAFNYSAHIALLGDASYQITAVGRDELGRSGLDMMRRYRVKTELVQESDKPTGACIVTLGENGIPSYNVLTDVAYDNIVCTPELVEKINALHADVFCFNTLIQRGRVSRASLNQILNNCAFENIFCDINIRQNCYDKESLSLCLEKSTIVKISEEEAHYLYDTGLLESGAPLAAGLHAAYPNINLLVYTLGPDGSRVYELQNGAVHCSGIPEKVKVVSTVGAGDCYGAAFLHFYLAGDGIDEAIKKASARSSIVVANKAAIPEALM